MNQISELQKILSESFDWNKARLNCFTQMLLSIFKVRTVNLREIAIGFSSHALPESRYLRLKRFFWHFEFNFDLIARWIFKLFAFEDKKIYLTIDRTNWFWGKSKINILTLAITYEGIAIPLLWQLLNKSGNATAKEHQAIVSRFIHIFGKENIAGILADREFASEYFFNWCNKNTIPFYIRIKEGSILKIKGKKYKTAKRMFNHLNQKQTYFFPMDVEIFSTKVYLAGARSERGELMVVATNQTNKQAIAIYLRRWEIETLFGSLKQRGFRFEQTHLTKLARIEKLMALLAIGFCWAHKIGEWYAIKRPIRWNLHKGTRRPQYSYFRYGLDFIRDILLQTARKTLPFKRCLQQLLPPTANNLEIKT